MGEQFKDFTELAISIDITTRISLAALAGSHSIEIINHLFDGIEENLVEVYGDDADKVKSLINIYRKSAEEFKKLTEVS